jgi:hypothetical protein
MLSAMTKRLQVLLDDDELAEIQAVAKRQRKTTAAWVREALRRARGAPDAADVERRLEAIRVAARYQGPTSDMGQMLQEIERGYLDSDKR